jgi:phospholipid N-methyltransferase
MNSSPKNEAREKVSTNRQPPDWLLFFTKFLRHGTAIAAVAPSSPWLAQAVVRGIDFSQSACIVELGAGTGSITEELVRHAGKRCRVLIVERDADFCRRLRERFPGADIAEADARDLERLLTERGIESVDHVLCGLPLPSFDPSSRDHILDIVRRRLAPSGTFCQLTHMPFIYYPLYRHYFESVKFRFIVRNLPPGGFYVCQGARALAVEPAVSSSEPGALATGGQRQPPVANAPGSPRKNLP